MNSAVAKVHRFSCAFSLLSVGLACVVIAATPDSAGAQAVRHEERVDFGDGEWVTLRITYRESSWLIGHQPLASQYEEFAALARSGNAVVAENLHAAVKRCESAYTSKSDVDAAVEYLRTERKLRLPGQQPVPLKGDADADDAARTFLLEPYEYCKGLTSEQRTSASEWLALAVRHGDVDAVAAALETEQDPEEQQRLWETLWANGEPQALGARAAFYEQRAKGTNANPDDLMQAYAHLFAMNEFAKYSARIRPPGRGRLRFFDMIAADVVRVGQMLTAAQKKAAIRMAADLMRSNPACCSPL